MSELPGTKLHGEAGRESFSVFTDFGHASIELEWEQFPFLRDLVSRLEKYFQNYVASKATETNADNPDPCACGYIGDMSYAGNVATGERFHQRNTCWPRKSGMFSEKSFLCTWVLPQDCDPPHGITHDKTYELLIEAFLKKEGYPGSGWDTKEPVLIGYPLDGRIQLLSGSHRWAAAKDAGIKIPVLMRQRSVIEASFGLLSEWEKIMKAPPSSEAST